MLLNELRLSVGDCFRKFFLLFFVLYIYFNDYNIKVKIEKNEVKLIGGVGVSYNLPRSKNYFVSFYETYSNRENFYVNYNIVKKYDSINECIGDNTVQALNKAGFSKYFTAAEKKDVSSMGTHINNTFQWQLNDFVVSCDAYNKMKDGFVHDCDRQFYLSFPVNPTDINEFDKVFIYNLRKLYEKNYSCSDSIKNSVPYYFSLMKTVYLELNDTRDKIESVGNPIIRYIDTETENDKIDVTELFLENDWKSLVKENSMMILVRAYNLTCMSYFYSQDGSNVNDNFITISFEEFENCTYGLWSNWIEDEDLCMKCRSRTCIPGVGNGVPCSRDMTIIVKKLNDKCNSAGLSKVLKMTKLIPWWAWLMMSLFITSIIIAFLIILKKFNKKTEGEPFFSEYGISYTDGYR